MNLSRSTLLKTLAVQALIGAVALPHAAHAQTLIYTNGALSTGNAKNISSASIADDFVFSSTRSFDQVRVWLMDTSAPNNTLNNFGGTLSWLIYNNNAGLPGTIFASGTTSAVTLTDTGLKFGSTFSIFQADFSVPSQTLTAGTYWFRIRENGITDGADFTSTFWMDSGSSTGFQTVAGNGVNPTTWGNNGATNRAFNFFASSAPEPGTLPFLALGGTLVLARRRRK
ncbi:PEP-CTERM sorting domain-containing protein [Armatimonas sp.]|uniref:PEP-CTERM sorting domain-containing protein n=1 Tax=Armatimonas sp. TaxID=1872638 RepID=UPI00286CD801|nr:PEP-CTERM sorting domain-containing protein [Armatimonas sp.]